MMAPRPPARVRAPKASVQKRVPFVDYWRGYPPEKKARLVGELGPDGTPAPGERVAELDRLCDRIRRGEMLEADMEELFGPALADLDLGKDALAATKAHLDFLYAERRRSALLCALLGVRQADIGRAAGMEAWAVNSALGITDK